MFGRYLWLSLRHLAWFLSFRLSHRVISGGSASSCREELVITGEVNLLLNQLVVGLFECCCIIVLALGKLGCQHFDDFQVDSDEVMANLAFAFKVFLALILNLLVGVDGLTEALYSLEEVMAEKRRKELIELGFWLRAAFD